MPAPSSEPSSRKCAACRRARSPRVAGHRASPRPQQPEATTNDSLSPPDFDFLTAPLIVAVTGHRDLLDEDRKALEKAFKEALYKSQHDVHGENERILLSALAEGADTLAAQVALQEPNYWKVIAPLPLPPDVYRTDFKGQALAEFDDLLTKCSPFFVGYAPGCTPENTREYGHHRDLQYAFVGEYLTQHCQVLVAFWDGQDTQKVGGTAQIVAMQQRGLPTNALEIRRDDEGTLLDAPEGGRTIQIWTRRQEHVDDVVPESKLFKAIPLETGTSAQSDEHIKERRHEWQTFVEAARTTPVDVPCEELPQLSQDSPSVLREIRRGFVAADFLAKEQRGRVDTWFNIIIGVAVVFTLCVGIALAFEEDPTNIVSLALSWGFLLVASTITRRTKKSKSQNRQQDYRALAEAWRVCFFWRSVGIEDDIASGYLRHQRGELDWIRHTLRAYDLKARALNEVREVGPEAFQLVYDKWVKGQAWYFKERTVPRFRKTLVKCRNWSWLAVFVGLCASAVAAIAHLKADPHHAFSGLPWQEDVLLFARTFLSANLLSSPFTPAALLLSRMESWPLYPKRNTQAKPSPDNTPAPLKLRGWVSRRNVLLRVLGVSVFVLVLALASASGPDAASEPARESWRLLESWLQVVALVCFFAPALFFLWGDFKALPEHIESYERMIVIFERTQQMLEEMAPANPKDPDSRDWSGSETPHRARRILRELGREALHENGEWLLIHRDRPLDIEA